MHYLLIKIQYVSATILPNQELSVLYGGAHSPLWRKIIIACESAYHSIRNDVTVFFPIKFIVDIFKYFVYIVTLPKFLLFICYWQLNINLHIKWLGVNVTKCSRRDEYILSSVFTDTNIRRLPSAPCLHKDRHTSRFALFTIKYLQACFAYIQIHNLHIYYTSVLSHGLVHFQFKM